MSRLGSGSPVSGLGSFTTRKVYLFIFVCKYEEETYFIYKQELDIVSLSENRTSLDTNDYHVLITSIFNGAGAFLVRNTVIIVLSIGIFIT